jgi:hypothetical protein
MTPCHLAPRLVMSVSPVMWVSVVEGQTGELACKEARWAPGGATWMKKVRG